MSPSKRKIEQNKKLAVLGKQLLKEYIQNYHNKNEYKKNEYKKIQKNIKVI